jgi:hypothetical protein
MSLSNVTASAQPDLLCQRKSGKRSSLKKIQANRRNALKSTGPRTFQGKDYSRRNSLKHGFFSTDLSKDFVFLGENGQQFNELLDQLRQEHQPVGIAEELEVGRIAQCWWKLKRASRYENAELFYGQVRLISQTRPMPSVQEMIMSRDKAFTLLLESAEQEIEASGKISSELKAKMLAADPSFLELWPQLQAIAEQSLSPNMQAGHGRAVALETTKLAKKYMEYKAEKKFESIMNLFVDRAAIPDRDGLDKLLRYEAAIERNLDRALDRLEHLQRRRKGEPVPRPVSVRLTR